MLSFHLFLLLYFFEHWMLFNIFYFVISYYHLSKQLQFKRKGSIKFQKLNYIYIKKISVKEDVIMNQH